MSLIEKKVGEELHVCETCGYERGFHVSFKRHGELFEVILICPECVQRYDVNWRDN